MTHRSVVTMINRAKSLGTIWLERKGITIGVGTQEAYITKAKLLISSLE